MTQDLTDKRRHSRHKFAYPVKFDLFKPSAPSLSFTGVLFDISIGGSCVQFEDRYGRVDLNGMQGSRLKLAIGIPEKEPIYLTAIIHWIRRESKKGFNLLMGIEFKDIADWQLEQIETFMHLKNKDQKMLWNLWENYVPQK
jgi:hypothetical protein